ncbi:MAG: exopolysaccharide biosynthesis polyprenyl glycosylphosphotransferase [Rhodospirillales bacterium]|jgi:exopolysaccharide biosynthesis polyprenyl glycosylphosphotransferase|nr:exopolysaccharide biosynthesis polyprenyl glycosylphosphotransferase [Rhodospirillales bacterium]
MPTSPERTIASLAPPPVGSAQAAVKNVLDPVLAAIILLLLSPLFLALMAAIKLTSKGPVFFRQTRYGQGKRLFDIWKFRSMYIDRCDTRRGDAILQAVENDPRVTPLGRFLRRTSLDELPQLINVIKGEMSLVGPRPHAVAEDDHFAELVERYDGRFRVKPGITGLAQVSGLRGEITSLEFIKRRVAKDNEYIDRLSVALDGRILLRTVSTLFRKDGAY